MTPYASLINQVNDSEEKEAKVDLKTPKHQYPTERSYSPLKTIKDYLKKNNFKPTSRQELFKIIHSSNDESLIKNLGILSDKEKNSIINGN